MSKPTVTYQEYITRKDVRDHYARGYIYLFGDNLRQFGRKGQAREMRGEPNAFGIPTKKYPGNRPEDFMTDDEYELNVWAIDQAFKRIPQDAKVIVIPESGLGTGLAALDKKAPRTFAYLQQKLKELLP